MSRIDVEDSDDTEEEDVGYLYSKSRALGFVRGMRRRALADFVGRSSFMDWDLAIGRFVGVG